MTVHLGGVHVAFEIVGNSLTAPIEVVATVKYCTIRIPSALKQDLIRTFVHADHFPDQYPEPTHPLVRLKLPAPPHPFHVFQRRRLVVKDGLTPRGVGIVRSCQDDILHHRSLSK
jgi:hypothetical protein